MRIGYNTTPDPLISVPKIQDSACNMDRRSENGSPERRKELIELKRSSMAIWKHFNLHGEYDFSDEKMEDSVGLEKTPKKLERSGV